MRPRRRRPGRAGLFAIADAGAQLVVELCGAVAGERILDACAGSGGKTAHLLALATIARAWTRSTSRRTSWTPRGPH
jgi:16S rRNA C967 or C1407 C5-methylase (RsmB/RsmF family)